MNRLGDVCPSVVDPELELRAREDGSGFVFLSLSAFLTSAISSFFYLTRGDLDPRAPPINE